mmetsp:Transcript_91500/g.262004  ORF Transcript_91500/g.262004 Transcript_91500/m.262004 type:complete len:554 (+) Transcript_91500:221-1882(+)
MEKFSCNEATANLQRALTREINIRRGLSGSNAGSVAGSRASRANSPHSSRESSANFSPSLPPTDAPCQDLPEGEVGFCLTEDVDGQAAQPVFLDRARSAYDIEKASPGESSRLLAPQGFRRHFLNSQADEAGIPTEQRPEAWQQPFLDRVRPLVMSGYYDSLLGISLDPDTGADRVLAQGSASNTQVCITLVKMFVGSGVTFLPGGFSYGGWLFSPIMLFVIAIVQGVAVARLISCCKQLDSNSYADIALVAVGRGCEFAVQMSLLLSVFGAVICYMAFVAKLASSMGMHPTMAVFLQLPFVMPLSLTRSLGQLDSANLFGSMLIVFGLMVVLAYGMGSLVAHGAAKDVAPFYPSSAGIFVGFACFAFEGVPLLLPIRASMKNTDMFVPLYMGVLAGVAVFYVVFALLNYLPYGKTEVQTVVLLNLPHGVLTSIVQFGYMFALVLSIPLNFLPGARILELWAFGIGKKSDHFAASSSLRLSSMAVCALLAIKGGENFDKLLAFVGTFCSVPIQFIYPALFHLKLCKPGWFATAVDFGIIAVGVSFMVLTLVAM